MRTAWITVLAVVLFAGLAVGQTTRTWDGSTDSNWDDADNWDTGVPDQASDDDAVIPNVTTKPTKTGDLEFDDGTLVLQTDAGTVTVNGMLYWARTTGESSTGNSVGTGATLDVDGTTANYNVLGDDGTATLTVNGTADFLRGLALGADQNSGNGNGNDSAVTLGAAGVLNIGSGGNYDLSIYGGGDLNAGSAGTLSVGGDIWQNEGASTIALPANTTIGEFLRVGNNNGNSATVTMADGGTLDVDGNELYRYSFIGRDGTAAFTVSGTATFLRGLVLGGNESGSDSGNAASTVTIEAGKTLTVGVNGQDLILYDASTLTAGVNSILNVTNNLRLYGGSELVLDSTVDLNVGGDLYHHTGESTIPLPDAPTIDGFLRVGWDNLSDATVTMGDTLDVDGDVVNKYSVIGREGTADFTVSGTATFLRGLVLSGNDSGSDNGNVASFVTIQDGKTLTVGVNGQDLVLYDGSTLTAGVNSILNVTNNLRLYTGSELVLDSTVDLNVGGDLYHYTGASTIPLPEDPTIDGFLRVGWDNGSDATVTMGDTLDVDGDTAYQYSVIGREGDAAFTVSGTATFLRGLVLGGDNSGNDSGNNGSSTVTIQNGKTLIVGVNGDDLRLWDDSTLTAAAGSKLDVKYDLRLYEGSDLDLASDVDLDVGDELYHETGDSTIPLPNGAQMKYLRVGFSTGSTGTVTTAESGTLTVFGNDNGQYSVIGREGDGVFTVSGTATFTRGLVLGGDNSGNDSGNNGSSTLTIESGKTLIVGVNGQDLRLWDDSTLTAAAGSKLDVKYDLRLYEGSDLDLASDVDLDVGDELYHHTGESTIPLPNGAQVNYLRVAMDAGSSATVTMGNTLDVIGNGGGQYSVIGQDGSATFTVSGTATFTKGLGLGTQANGNNDSGSGHLTVSGSASLDVDDELRVRGNAGSTFTIDGGNATIEVDGYRQDSVTSTLDLDIDSSGITAINCDGAVALHASGTFLDVAFTGGNVPDVNDTFDVIINDLTDAVSGKFKDTGGNLLNGGTDDEWFVTAGAFTIGLRIDYDADTGNDVQLTVTSKATPTPPTVTLSAPATATAPYTLTITFSEVIQYSTLSAADFDVTGGGTVTIDNFDPVVNAAVYTATVTPSVAGTVSIFLKDGSVTDVDNSLTLDGDSNTEQTDFQALMTLSSTSIAEGASGRKVGDLDVDNLPGPFTFSLVSGAGDTHNSLFTIANDDELTTAAEFDFETLPNSYDIRVEETGSGTIGTFTITVTDVAEASGLYAVAEVQTGTTLPVGTVQYLMGDNTSVTYDIITTTFADGDTHFDIDTNTGELTMDNAAGVAGTVYWVEVEATGNNTGAETMVIKVTSVTGEAEGTVFLFK